MLKKYIPLFSIVILLLSACAPAAVPRTGGLRVLAVESFLADIAQNVAGQRAVVDTLIPIGADPHAFEPTPQDVARIADSSVLIINGAGLETWLVKVLQNAGGERALITAAAGLPSRQAREGEAVQMNTAPSDSGDPHFWLDPTKVVRYVENIRDGLSQVDPAGKDVYTKNAAAYIAKLHELDAWIQAQVQQIQPQRRLLVTNHETFGYFADRYGFKITGTIVPSVDASASPSAQQLAGLVDHIRASGAPAIFLEAGTNRQLADQVAQEAHVQVNTNLYTHWLSPPDGPAPTYIDMLKYDVSQIVGALK